MKISSFFYQLYRLSQKLEGIKSNTKVYDQNHPLDLTTNQQRKMEVRINNNLF